jgi:hypothetical protein
MEKVGFIKYKNDAGAKTCDQCNSVFYSHIHNAKRCSKRCKDKYRANFEKLKRGVVEVKARFSNCVICNTHYELPLKSTAKTCSKACSKEQSRLRHANYKNIPEHVERIKGYQAKYRNTDKRKEWLENNKESIAEKKNDYIKKKRKEDLNYRLLCVLRATIGRILKKKKKDQNRSSYCSYTPEQLRLHLESKFRDGMTWDNYGRLGWHIDHIKPLTAFTFFDDNGNMILDQFKECMALENLQPLWYDENIRKGGLRRMRIK